LTRVTRNILRMVYPPMTVTHLSTNPAGHDRGPESSIQPVDHKSDVI